VILNIIKAHKNKTVKHWHNIFQVGREIMKSAGEIWTVNNWENINEHFAVSP
jgi:hypothetical protein